MGMSVAARVFADTFTVTSSSCAGPGSIMQAIEQANLNPGADRIEFASGLVVNDIATVSCGVIGGIDPNLFYMATVTEDLIINGNGAQLLGAPAWVTQDGLANVVGLCPSDNNVQGTIAAEAPGFLRIDSGVRVEVNDLTMLDLSAVISLRDGAIAELNNVTARRINDWFRDCERSAIEVVNGDAVLSINDSYFEQIQNTASNLGAPDMTVFRGSNVISGSGDLNVSATRFENALSAIQWNGNANIETSQFVFSGWVNVFGVGTTNITNSAFQSRTGPLEGDSIRASSNATVNVTASSMSIAFPENQPTWRSGFGAIVAVSGATINIKESAVGVGIPSVPGALLRSASGGSITADVNTWVQPVTSQSASDLRTITSQPALMTDPPGLPNILSGLDLFPRAITPLLGTSTTPGVLIDAIPDANGANVLLSPIDNSVITTDVLGNPRVDGNGTRTIGAVQLTLAPYLVVSEAASEVVELFWTRPRDPSTGAVTGYQVCYGTGSVPDGMMLGTQCENGDGNPGMLKVISSDPNTTQGTVTNLSNGEIYWFLVRGINPGPGPWSNVVTATPQNDDQCTWFVIPTKDTTTWADKIKTITFCL